jgi:hypothetical protein
MKTPLGPNEMQDLRIEAESFIRSGMSAEVNAYAEVGSKLHLKGITLRRLKALGEGQDVQVSASKLLKDDVTLRQWARKALSVRQFSSWARGLNLTTEQVGLSCAALVGGHKAAWTETGNVSDKGAAAIRLACSGGTLDQVKDALGIVKGEGRKVTVESIVKDCGKLDVTGIYTVALTLALALPAEKLSAHLKAIAAEIKRQAKAEKPAEIKAEPIMESAVA